MSHRLTFFLAVASLVVSSVVAPGARAQVVRFETTVGSFDMVLNPTNNSVLQGHVDNLLHYVGNGNYNGSWINRAAEGFVLQMGGFFSHTKRVPINIDSTRPVATFDSILQGEPAAETGLSNTLGMVSMALPGLPTGGTNQDGGTSSFFVNLTDNNFLDADFTVFAAISDMTTINQIMALMQTDLTAVPDFGAGSGNLGFSDVPLDDNSFQVFIKRAFEITDTLAVAKAQAGVQSLMTALLSAGGGSNSGGGGVTSAAPLTAAVVPEPATWVVCLVGLASLAMRRRR